MRGNQREGSANGGRGNSHKSIIGFDDGANVDICDSLDPLREQRVSAFYFKLSDQLLRLDSLIDAD